MFHLFYIAYQLKLFVELISNQDQDQLASVSYNRVLNIWEFCNVLQQFLSSTIWYKRSKQT